MPRKNANPAAKKARAKLKAQMAGGKAPDQPQKRKAHAMRFSRQEPATFELRIAAHHLLKEPW